MNLADFSYELPSHLIASHPMVERTGSRLLVMRDNESLEHRRFAELPDLLAPGDLLVLNDTRVIPARLKARKTTGGRIEIFLERITSETTALVQIRASKSPAVGSVLCLETDGAIKLEVLDRADEFYCIRFPAPGVREIIEQYGQIPLPPYIDRDVESADRSRYQTVYARHDGSVAAPTAGLHFDNELLQALEKRGVDTTYVTLHVGAGTFVPVRTPIIEDHRMHTEWFEVSAATCDKVRACRKRGGRVIAVGTTSVRCLESASEEGEIHPLRDETRLFIYPGYRFRCVDAILTNFHLPESSLLMLVSAFAGLSEIMRAYQEAIGLEYRFFSYGDAMLLLTKAPPTDNEA